MPTLQQQIQAFLPQARVVNTHAELLSMLVNLEEDPAYDEAMERVCLPYVNWVYDTYNGTTPHAYIYEFRKAIKHEGLSQGFLYFMREREVEVTARQKAYAVDIQIRQENQYPITPDQATALVEKATWLLTSGNYADVVVGLCLLTGKRPYEVAVKSRFRCHRHPLYRANQYLYCHGLAKTRSLERERQLVEIPVLIDPLKICEAHKRVRQLNPRLSNYHPRYFAGSDDTADSAFMKYCGARFREQCTKHLRPLVPEMKTYLGHHVTPQSLRKLYECLTEAWWDHTGWAAPRFIMEILNHADLRHAGSYLDVCLTQQVPKRFLAHNRIKELIHDRED
jgi:Telomere resolvase